MGPELRGGEDIFQRNQRTKWAGFCDHSGEPRKKEILGGLWVYSLGDRVGDESFTEIESRRRSWKDSWSSDCTQMV